VIVGRLIPAGPGGQLRLYQKLATERDEQLAIDRAEDAARLAAELQTDAAE
jgi:DNA-directed RNA polymerase subunit beta'